jgi:hypothetical protein
VRYLEKKRVMLVVETDDANIMTRACETLARAAAGLALEDINAIVMVGATEED